MDYKRFDLFTDDGIFFVCRLKKNAVITVFEEFKVPKDFNIISDKMVFIGSSSNCTENVYRVIVILDEKGKEMRLITNRFDSSAEEISEIYRSRGAIELFFKWIKQHMNNKHYYDRSINAVKNQIYLALIFYCLNVLIQIETKSLERIRALDKAF